MNRTKLTAAVLGCAATAVAIALAAGVRVNTTKSIPIGLYWVTDAPAVPGAYVFLCPPPREVFDMALERGYIGPGSCKGGYGYLMKRVLAAKGDQVLITAAGVEVNDTLLPNSQPMAQDGLGRPMPKVSVRTALDGQVLLMSDISSTSFDARYYGLIDELQVESVIRPILTW